MELVNELSVEKKLVIESSRWSDNDRAYISKLVKQQINWERVVQYCIRNKVLYLLLYHLERYQLIGYLPKYLSKLVSEAMQVNRVKNDIKFAEMERICRKFEENDIKIVPVKGSYLIDNLYCNRSIRETNDIDALISKKDISKIDQIMKELGYSNKKYNDKLKKFENRSTTEKILYKTKMYNLLPYVKVINSPVNMKIIFDFSHALDFTLNSDVVQEMLDVSYMDNNIRRLLSEHYLIHMCCHHYREASHVEWIKIGKDLNLIKFCDVREFILKKMDKESLQKAVTFAKKHNLEKPLFFVLFFLDTIYSDGYEKELMEKLDIKNKEFVYMFGDNGDEIKYLRKKEFWESFFSDDNKDEVVVLNPKYDEVM